MVDVVWSGYEFCCVFICIRTYVHMCCVFICIRIYVHTCSVYVGSLVLASTAVTRSYTLSCCPTRMTALRMWKDLTMSL